VDQERNVVAASWDVGIGQVCRDIAPLPAGADLDLSLTLVMTLAGLSEALWRRYTHPASASGSLDVNTEGWRREGDRAAFGLVVDAVRSPNLPSDGLLIVSYVPVEEAAHRVGRALHAFADASLTAAVTAEVEVELAAVGEAELGDLSGRGRQAVLLTREDASPVQVAAADQMLRADPFGDDDLFTEVDPTAAAVAAAHWLQAAADVAAEMSGLEPTDVVVEADNITALPYTTPTTVLEMMDDGATPYAAVTGLIRDAMRVADGFLPGADALHDAIADAEDLTSRHTDDGGDLAAELATIRLTPLNPQRPAVDLLEDLLLGIRGCWQIYQEYADDPDLDNDDEDDEEGFTELRRAFVDEVRAVAAADADRLT
jgi:hypothetical protein